MYNINSKYNPITFNDVITDKRYILHNKLYNDALNKYFLEQYNKYVKENNLNNYDYNTYLHEFIHKKHWVETNINKDNYFLPSSVICINKTFPFTKEKINLEKYWNNEYLNKQKPNMDEHIINNDNKLYQYEVCYYDYVNGNVVLNNKLNDDELELKFNELNNKIKINENIFYKKY